MKAWREREEKEAVRWKHGEEGGEGGGGWLEGGIESEGRGGGGGDAVEREGRRCGGAERGQRDRERRRKGKVGLTCGPHLYSIKITTMSTKTASTSVKNRRWEGANGEKKTVLIVGGCVLDGFGVRD